MEEEKKKKAPFWMILIALILVIALLVVYLIYPKSGSSNSIKAKEIAAASYPDMAFYPQDESDQKAYDAWAKDQQKRIREMNPALLKPFFEKTGREFLADKNGENRVFSPVNLYMALACLAMISGGESQRQILDLLDQRDLSFLQQQTQDLWTMAYRDDGIQTSILANSIWLQEGIDYDQKTLQALARNCYADSFQGDLGSSEMNQALQAWLNEKTGDLLQEQSEGMELDQDSILALASTLLFQARWQEEFLEKKTKIETFHTAKGDIQAEFMQERSEENYYTSNHFCAIAKSLAQGGEMRWILPEHGLDIQALLGEPELYDFLFSKNLSNWPDKDYLFVNESIVKFDIASTIDLKDGLKNLGITDLFVSDKADFSPLCPKSTLPMQIDQATHSARVLIDEEGLQAAAFTVISADATAIVPEEREVEFVLDRPFLFEIVNDQALPLFIGIVQTPK